MASQILRPWNFIYTYAYKEDEKWLNETDASVLNSKESIEAFLAYDDVADEINKTAADIKECVRYIENKGHKALVYTLLSDTHYVQGGNWEYTLATIKAVYDASMKPDGIIHLGDFTDGCVDKETCREYSHRVIDGLNSFNLPLHVAVGNHDANYYRNNPELLTEKERFDMYIACADSKSATVSSCCSGLCRAVDAGDIRIIILSAYDNSEKDRYGFSEEEFLWVEEQLNAAKNDSYKILFLSHDAPLTKLDYWANNIRNGEKLAALIDCWNSDNDNRVLGFIYGHTHANFVYNDLSFPIISVGCSKVEYSERYKPEGSVTPIRYEDEATQELWDTLIIDIDDGSLYFKRFGAGFDRMVDMNTPKVWAHRGASGYAPENTLEAFKLAAELGADGIELDVQLTRDGQIVVIHDETIDRVSDGHGRVIDQNLDELRKYNFNTTNKEYPHTDIPLLSEALELIKPYEDMLINIELKTSIVFYPGLEKRVVKLVDEMGMSDRVIYSSFNHESVLRVRKLGKKAAFLYADGIANPSEYADKYDIQALHPSVNNVKYPGLIENAHNNGLMVNVWTVNETSDMECMRQYGVDAIITNYPDKALSLYGRKSDEELQEAIDREKERVAEINRRDKAAKKNERNTTIDVAKCIAIVMVVAGHVMSNIFGVSTPLITLSHMPVFYAVSGYFLYTELHKYDEKRLIFRKMSRLIKPYIIWSGVSFVLHLGIIFLRDIIKAGLSTDSIYVFANAAINEFNDIFWNGRSFWFLVQLFVAILIFIMAIEISKQFKCSLIMILGMFYLIVMMCPGIEILSMYKFIWLFPFMIFGYYFKALAEGRVVRYVRSFVYFGWIFAVVGAIIIVRSFGLLGEHYIALNGMAVNLYNLGELSLGTYCIEYVKMMVCSTLELFSILWLASAIKGRIANILAKIGQYTLEIYVLHMFLIYAIKFII